MLNEVVHLNKIYDIPYDPKLEITVIETLDVEKRAPSKCIIVCPGGGYEYISKREGDPICVAFMLQGYVTCKLTYSVDHEHHQIFYPVQHIELLCAMDYIYKNADKYCIDRNKITMVGFSAGGHLVASYSYKYKELADSLGYKEISHLRPSAICLGYAVISLVTDKKCTTKDEITGRNKSMYAELSPELHVTSDYPPTFLWTTIDDDVINPLSTILMERALNDKDVKNKTIYYPKGNHGLALGNKLTSLDGKVYEDVQNWVKECDSFFETCWRNDDE